ncbi:MAG: TolC family protein [Labilithrix sp.]|nr:TolC family protein [Labilithrix sp.]MCW5810634.1 TolC family protein [Labilithrix sp.]
MLKPTLAGVAMFVLVPVAAAAGEPPQPPPPVDVRPMESPKKAAAGAVTLAEAVRRALERNPNTEIAQQEVERSVALARQVRAAWLPTLVANGTYTRLDDDRRLANGNIVLPKDSMNANLQLNVPLIAPRQWVASQRAKEGVATSRASAADVRRAVALQTARAYLTVIAEHRVLQAAQRALRTSRAFEDYAVTRFEGGVGNKLDAVRAAQERATADVRVKQELAALSRAQEALGVLMGEEGGVDAAEDPSLSPPPSVDAAMNEASSRRADIAVDRDRLAVARRASRDSWVDYLPTLSALGQPFYQNPPTFTQPTTGWQALLVLQLPLYDGGLRYGVQEERSALEAEARARLEGALRQARSEVRVAFDEMRRSDEALEAAREAASLAKESLDLARAAYEAGATSNIEVVDAERRYHQAETGAAVAEDASRQARLDLLAACGRFP